MGKYYVVFVGGNLGLYYRWEDAQAYVDRYSRCRHQSYKTYDEVAIAWQNYQATSQNYDRPSRRIQTASPPPHATRRQVQEDLVGTHLTCESYTDVREEHYSFGMMNVIFEVLIGVLLIYVVVVRIVSSIIS
ncbi:uncharacterized protein LOC131249926 [Magnolia sinica]|uniref:uncharacterized protein LOC131249926 n=1 Tax=Magnolia sinica TaxID=86752 RepID=UPI002658A882|nr:uncharacterized protein LOC131249926 [Magnolia sinica]